jgi:hypothetical protein
MISSGTTPGLAVTGVAAYRGRSEHETECDPTSPLFQPAASTDRPRATPGHQRELDQITEGSTQSKRVSPSQKS